jgi:aryl-alcohol dehydrogenase-like predicted oxidoreductase
MTGPFPVAETMGAFARLVEAGKVRAIGCSNFATWRIAESQTAAGTAGGPTYVAAQFRYSYLRPKLGADLDVQVAVNDQLRDFCRSRDVTLLAYSPLLQGAYTRGSDALAREYAGPDSEARLRVLAEVAADAGVPANQVVLAWLRQQDPSVLALVTASRPEQLGENLASLLVTLTADQMERLSQAGA